MDDKPMTEPVPIPSSEELAHAARRLGVRRSDSLLAMSDALLHQSNADESSQQQTLAAIAELVHAATHDQLTGLPTRGVLLNRLEQALEAEAAVAAQVAVLFIDVDNFKLVNDSLGHDAGDELLREMSRRITACVGAADTVSRFGGDELVVLLPQADQGLVSELGALVLATMAAPIRMAGREVATSVSIGAALAAPGAQTAEQLLRDADTALYAAKSRGRNRMERFNEELHARVARRMRVETELRLALREGGLYVHYQPQVKLATGRVVGLEALARWHHAELGQVPPAEFIPVAEESRLIDELGWQVLRTACRQLAAWSAAGIGPALSMTVNISPRQLDNPDFAAELQRVLDETGIRPDALCLELTESGLMSRTTELVDMLERVRRIGVYVAIDDFGTEQSALSRLRELPVEVLKIDRSFIDGLGAEAGDTAIVSSILSLAYAMGKHVIAEGVETAEQAAALSEMGCPVAQGFLFARPVDATEIPRLLGRPLWQAPVSWAQRLRPKLGSHARRAHPAFIDEFLFHIGAPMGEKKTGSAP
ncbi:EAL domain-containing protein [Pelomonas sp. SE-A7]|uniref:putative bifunctional diguanylate cyclase/phosphodiesterase n=1 Tax=Pelomonas sp. SE-A7 TaxID=3054953 RepID=UPI00259C9CDB|nr:EAL domain-containing protein [Pelomonas sp. SE-A7]MDM4765211.1 EAL domain-containing protein [Pelomonas sp. SE-A7]